MKMVKSLLLGSAAGIAAIAGAQAADLPVKAKPVEYVKVCSAYGAGYYYIPGTQTCIKIGGFLRLNIGFGEYSAYTPQMVGAGPADQRDRPFVNTNTRLATQIDIRSNTDYGVLRTYVYSYLNTGTYASSAFSILSAYTQLAGFTVGQFKGSYLAPWSAGGGSTLAMYRPEDASASRGIEYKWDLGGGISTAIGVFDPRRFGIFDRQDTINVGAFANSQATLGTGTNSGYHMPDIHANVRIEQAWGGLHLGAKVSEVAMVYNAPNEGSGFAKTKYGYAVNASLNLKNIPTGAGDQIWATVAYAKGAMNNLFSSTPASSLFKFGPGQGSAYNTLAFAYNLDAVFDSQVLPGGQFTGFGGDTLQLTQGWSATLAYEHSWIPAKLKSSFYGNYAAVSYNETAKAIICTSQTTGASRFGFSAGSVCDPNWQWMTIGSQSTWYPARDYEIAVDINYNKLMTNSSGTMTGLNGTTSVMPTNKPTGTGIVYAIQDQATVFGGINFLRTW